MGIKSIVVDMERILKHLCLVRKAKIEKKCRQYMKILSTYLVMFVVFKDIIHVEFY